MSSYYVCAYVLLDQQALRPLLRKVASIYIETLNLKKRKKTLSWLEDTTSFKIRKQKITNNDYPSKGNGSNSTLKFKVLVKSIRMKLIRLKACLKL